MIRWVELQSLLVKKVQMGILTKFTDSLIDHLTAIKSDEHQFQSISVVPNIADSRNGGTVVEKRRFERFDRL